MKKIILYFVLISFVSCSHETNYPTKEIYEINFSTKNKNVNRFFLGNKYFGYKGLNFKDSTSSYKLTLQNSLLKLKMKNRFISGFQSGFVIEDTITFYLHDLNQINTTPIKINFNNYKSKIANFLPSFSRENLEILKNRSSKIYTLDNNFKLQSLYLSDFYKKETTPKFDQLIFHNSTKINLDRLKKLKIYPMDFSSFIIVHNPLTGFYTILPNLERFSVKKNNFLEELTERVTYENKFTKKIKDTITINNLMNIDSTINIKNSVVIFKKKSKLIFSENSKLLFESCHVFFNGSQAKKLVIEGDYDNSILFDDCKVNISNSIFSNLSNFENDDIVLPSAITFYNSEVNIKNSTFKNNIIGDDFLNFYNSKFLITNSLIENSFADAIDSDFSNGEIYNLTLLNVGNDGLDFSGSTVKIQNSFFNYVQDKAISIGESSKVFINNSSIVNSELGIVVKDGSIVNSFSNIFKNNKIDYAVFFKKDFYPPPYLKTDSINSNTLNLFQDGSKINIEKETKVKYLNDVESLLYGKIYGKSSK